MNAFTQRTGLRTESKALPERPKLRVAVPWATVPTVMLLSWVRPGLIISGLMTRKGSDDAKHRCERDQH